MPMTVPRAPHPLGGRFRTAPGAILAILGALLSIPAEAYVFLDTSSPPAESTAQTGSPPPLPKPGIAPAESLPAARAVSRREPPHYRAVLFLSADSKLVYAYIGVLKALEQYGLAPDAVLAESKAVAVGAAWALGYDAASIESWFLAHPLESLLRPFPAARPVEDRAYRPDGRDPPQWDLPLSLQAFQSRSVNWAEVAGRDPGEYLHLSWAVAQLTHDGPAGPVENLEAAPRRLAVQVSDLESARGGVLTEGGLQNILKGSLLPEDVVRRRRRLWPCASGSLLSGHAIMPEKFPFACDRVILVVPGRRLRPPALQPRPLPWTDSLALRAKALEVAKDAEAFPTGLQAKALRIDLEPGPAFDPEESDPALWIELGYTSALRSMDILKSALPQAAAAQDAPVADPDERLGLNRNSINPLAPGGHQLLLDILRLAESDSPDSANEEAIAALTASGFYEDLDVDWAKAGSQEKALLAFEAKEKSKLRFRAGWSGWVAGDDLRERPPEVRAGLAWSEPFYIPVEADAEAVLGGNQPGFQWNVAIAPIYPWPMRLGLGYAYSQADFEAPFQTSALGPMGALPFPVRYRRHILRGFLEFLPSARFRSRSMIRTDSVTLFHRVDNEYYRDAAAPDSLKSIDFIQSFYLGLGRQEKDGTHPLSWKGRFRYLNPIVTSGYPRPEFSSAESKLRLAWRGFRLIDHYYWSDQERGERAPGDFFRSSAAFDLLQAGRIDAFSFQDGYFLRYLRSPGFQDVRAEYAQAWGRGGVKLSAGTWRNYGRPFFTELEGDRDFLGMRYPGRTHWEIQAGYATPLGALRAGMGGLGGEAPFYYIRIGSEAIPGLDDE